MPLWLHFPDWFIGERELETNFRRKIELTSPPFTKRSHSESLSAFANIGRSICPLRYTCFDLESRNSLPVLSDPQWQKSFCTKTNIVRTDPIFYHCFSIPSWVLVVMCCLERTITACFSFNTWFAEYETHCAKKNLTINISYRLSALEITDTQNRMFLHVVSPIFSEQRTQMFSFDYFWCMSACPDLGCLLNVISLPRSLCQPTKNGLLSWRVRVQLNRSTFCRPATFGHSRITDGEINVTISEEKRLVRFLMRRYRLAGRGGRPVLNYTESVKVAFGLGLIQMELNEKLKMLITSMWSRFVSIDIKVQQAIWGEENSFYLLW